MVTVTHFTHPGHLLQEMYENREYQCNGCKTNGIGKKYRCVHDSCNFDLHEHCATCPGMLSSFMHPEHGLKLVTREIGRMCNVCGDHIEGMFYKCNRCMFCVHPLCTQLPQFVRHALHSRTDHLPLELMPPPPSSPTFCLVCGVACSFWRYRCAICSINIHVPCVLASPYMDQPLSSRTVPPPNQQHPPPPGHPSFYGAYAGPSVPPPNQQHPPPPGHPPSYGAYAGPSIPPPGYPPGYGPYASVPPGHPPSYGAYAGPSVPPSGYPPASGYGSYAGTSAPPPYQPHPPSPAYAAYAYGVPFDATPYYYMHHQYQQQLPYHNVHMPPAVGGGGGGGTNGWKPNNMMSAIVGHLMLGVLGNAVFGVLQDLV